jgi:hypothetical protein
MLLRRRHDAGLLLERRYLTCAAPLGSYRSVWPAPGAAPIDPFVLGPLPGNLKCDRTAPRHLYPVELYRNSDPGFDPTVHWQGPHQKGCYF